MRIAIALLLFGFSFGPFFPDGDGPVDDTTRVEPANAEIGPFGTHETVSALTHLRLHPGRDSMNSDQPIRNRPPAEIPAAVRSR